MISVVAKISVLVWN